jgi:hypothetical protein
MPAAGDDLHLIREIDAGRAERNSVGRLHHVLLSREIGRPSNRPFPVDDPYGEGAVERVVAPGGERRVPDAEGGLHHEALTHRQRKRQWPDAVERDAEVRVRRQDAIHVRAPSDVGPRGKAPGQSGEL